MRVDWRAIRRGIVLNLVGRMVAALSGGISAILLARAYGPTTFGVWATASVAAMLVGTLVEGGLANTLLRRRAVDPDRLAAHVGAVLRARIGLAVTGAALAAALGAWVLPGSEALTVTAILLLAKVIDGVAATFVTVHHAREEFAWPNGLEIGRRVLFLLGVLTLSDRGASLSAIASWQLILAVLAAIPLGVRVALHVGIHVRGATSVMTTESFWFWWNGVVFWINGEVDQLMLTGLRGPFETGQYAAAVRLTAFLGVVAIAINHALIARLFESRTAERQARQRLFLATTALLTAFGAVAAIELHASGPALVQLLYGSEYETAGRILQILSVYLLFDFARQAPSWALSAWGRPRYTGLVSTGAAGLNVLLNLCLIPRFGAGGAAIATVLSTGTLTLVVLLSAGRESGGRLLGVVGLALVPALGLLAIHGATPASAPWYLPAMVGAGFGLGLAGLAVRSEKSRRSIAELLGRGAP